MDRNDELRDLSSDLRLCFLVKYVIAPLTPILGGVSEQCFDQSIAYMDYLIPDEQDVFDLWAVRSKEQA